MGRCSWGPCDVDGNAPRHSVNEGADLFRRRYRSAFLPTPTAPRPVFECRRYPHCLPHSLCVLTSVYLHGESRQAPTEEGTVGLEEHRGGRGHEVKSRLLNQQLVSHPSRLDQLLRAPRAKRKRGVIQELDKGLPASNSEEASGPCIHCQGATLAAPGCSDGTARA